MNAGRDIQRLLPVFILAIRCRLLQKCQGLPQLRYHFFLSNSLLYSQIHLGETRRHQLQPAAVGIFPQIGQAFCLSRPISVK
ncbi:hypothetical protein D3C75_1105910 [compost metagenome]